jgi:hypothetical protein
LVQILPESGSALDPDPYPDPHSSKMLDPDPYPDPHITNADPKHWPHEIKWSLMILHVWLRTFCASAEGFLILKFSF